MSTSARCQPKLLHHPLNNRLDEVGFGLLIYLCLYSLLDELDNVDSFMHTYQELVAWV